MKYLNLTPGNTEFVLLSFEGPDRYSMAGGLGVRMNHLGHTLASTGFLTHLFYIGDPQLPGEEKMEKDKLILHRWGQWISRYHPGGVYDGEEGKLNDFNLSIPDFVVKNIIQPAIARENLVVIMGEEWQMAETICRISERLEAARIRQKALVFWNANNTYGFDRIDWRRLEQGAVITTISKYMKNILEGQGLRPIVIPNGIPRELLQKVDDRLVEKLKRTLGADFLLCKIARWAADKRWLESMEAVAKLKELGVKVILLARGGREAYGREVMERAQALRLIVKDTATREPGSFEDYLKMLAEAGPADIINIKFQLSLDLLKVMYRAADAVLANSSHEPFGIVGLEVMASGGIAFTGSTGEDYALPFVNSLMMETANPLEIVGYLMYLQNYPQQRNRMRAVARFTSTYFTWESAVQVLLSKLENEARMRGILESHFTPSGLQFQIEKIMNPEGFCEEVERHIKLASTERTGKCAGR